MHASLLLNSEYNRWWVHTNQHLVHLCIYRHKEYWCTVWRVNWIRMTQGDSSAIRRPATFCRNFSRANIPKSFPKLLHWRQCKIAVKSPALNTRSDSFFEVARSCLAGQFLANTENELSRVFSAGDFTLTPAQKFRKPFGDIHPRKASGRRIAPCGPSLKVGCHYECKINITYLWDLPLVHDSVMSEYISHKVKSHFYALGVAQAYIRLRTHAAISLRFCPPQLFPTCLRDY